MFHDEIDLAPGKVKVKAGGGNAGHNGLRSITAHIGNDYNRVRIGVGHPGVKEVVPHYVLHDFAKAELRVAGAAARRDGGVCALPRARRQRPLPVACRPRRARERRSKPANKAARARRRSARAAKPHPAGERASKRAGALAENLKKWLSGRSLQRVTSL